MNTIHEQLLHVTLIRSYLCSVLEAAVMYTLHVGITCRHSGTCMYWQRRNALSYHETLIVIKLALSNLNLSSRYLLPHFLFSVLCYCSLGATISIHYVKTFNGPPANQYRPWKWLVVHACVCATLQTIMS